MLQGYTQHLNLRFSTPVTRSQGISTKREREREREREGERGSIRRRFNRVNYLRSPELSAWFPLPWPRNRAGLRKESSLSLVSNSTPSLPFFLSPIHFDLNTQPPWLVIQDKSLHLSLSLRVPRRGEKARSLIEYFSILLLPRSFLLVAHRPST